MFSIKKIFCLISLGLFVAGFGVGLAQAGTTSCSAIDSGNWSDQNTWFCDTGTGVPETDTIVFVTSPNTVVLDVDASVVRVVVDVGGDLDVAASPGGLTLSWISGASDISAADIDLFGDFTINALTGSPIDLILGEVDGAFDLNLNAEGNTVINGAIGANTPLAGIDTDQDGTITLLNSITTTVSQFIDDEVIVAADVTLTGGGINLRGPINADAIAIDRNLTISSTGASQINGTVGGSIPLNALLVQNATRIVLESDVTTTATQTYNSDVVTRTTTNLTGSLIQFNADIVSETITPTGHDLTVSGDASFTADVGSNTFLGGFENLNSLTVTGNADFNVAGGADIITDGAQSYNGSMLLAADATFTSLDGGNVIVRNSGGAHHLTVNTSGTTFLQGTIGSPRHASVTTDAAGSVRLSGLIDILVSGSDPVTFNDNVLVGPSGRITIDQVGTGDIVFNGPISQSSGSPHRLTINDVSGRTVFNNTVSVGQLTTNDGLGNDVTVINTSSFATDQGGANNGRMELNDPVELMQSVTIAELDAGQIFINNTLDEADGVSGVDVLIQSDNDVFIGPIGTGRLINSLVTDAGGTTTLNGHAGGNTPFTFNDDVILGQSILLSAESINFNGTLDLQSFDLSISAVDSTMNGVVSGSGNLTSNVADEIRMNAENTYTGQTIINNGNLDLGLAPSANNISTSSEIILASGSQLIPNLFTFGFELANGQTLSGDGAVSGGLFTMDGSVVSPGSSPGSLDVTELRMFTGSTYQVEIDGLTPGTGYDQLTAATVDLDQVSSGGGTLTVDLSSPIDLNDELVIVNNTGVDPVAGTFNGLAEGATVTAPNGSTFNISYAGGDGNDVVLAGACSTAITVTSAADSGAGTLRQAVLDVCPDGSIDFTGSMNIDLASEIMIDKAISITGSGHFVALSGGDNNRIFNVSPTGDLTLTTLFVTDGFNSGPGGGIFNQGTLYIEDSNFDGNESLDGAFAGGAIFNDGGATLEIVASTFNNNSGNRGGAIYNGDSGSPAMLTISNSTFTQNGSNAFEGGAILNRGVLVSTNNTFAANGGPATSGGNLFTWNASLTLNNTIVADSPSSTDCFIELSNSTQSSNNSLIESGNCDAALTDDPQLMSLDNQGGFTQVMPLSLQSPAVDAGSNALCTSEDQRGVIRPQLEGCDIGAYETEFLGVIHVAAGPTRSGPCIQGGCWANPFDNLADALAAAGPGSEVWVASGLYLPDVGAGLVDDDPLNSFTITESVAVYGGFNGSETERDQRDFVANITILSGDIDEDDANVDGNGIAETTADIMGLNAYNIIKATGDGVVLDGFTITAGYANGGTLPERRGGGIYCFTSSGNSVFSNNTWIANKANNAGGVMFNCNGTVTDSMFIANESEGFAGVGSFGFNAVLSNVSFINNSAASDAGAIRASDIEIDRGFFSGNQAGTDGGAIWGVTGFSLSNSLFLGNFAAGNGGAMSLRDSNSLTNVTFTGNVAGQSGGGIYSENGPIRVSGAQINLSNTIIWNNEDNSGVGTIAAGVSVDMNPLVRNSVFQGSGGSANWNNAAGNDGGGNIDQDPLFAQDVDLMMVPTIIGDAHLNPASPAIGAGDNALVNTAFDLDGEGRINGSVVDMGAYEFSDLIFKDGFEP